MNPARKLEKKYQKTYETFLKVVGNPRTGRAKTLAAMLLKVDEAQERHMKALRQEREAHDWVDAPFNREAKEEYEDASKAYFDLLPRLAEAGFPSNVFPILR